MRGILANLRWALFGSEHHRSPPAKGGPAPILVYWGGLVLMVVTIAGVKAAELATARLAQAVVSVRQSDVWLLGSNQVIQALSRVEYARWPARQQGLTYALPYTEAKVNRAAIAGEPVTVSPVGAGTFELRWPPRLPDSPKIVEVEWEVPLTALEAPDDDYRARMQALVPVTAYGLRFILGDGCGYEFERAAEKRESTLFSIGSTGSAPNNDFGTCGVGLRPTSHAGGAPQPP